MEASSELKSPWNLSANVEGCRRDRAAFFHHAGFTESVSFASIDSLLQNRRRNQAALCWRAAGFCPSLSLSGAGLCFPEIHLISS